ncbi:hypothetical protein [Rhodobacteraceae bacterium DSL-40]|uniref:hypothetical protein n=1 Tax=Amaricoccus sp. B4 TaxID=3368557 RepID=UPI0013A6916D
MFLSAVLPFIDFRSLQADGPKLLEVPTWPAATALASANGQVFQRNFGKVIPRPLKGLPGWIGESDICQFRKSAKFDVDGLYAKCVRKRLYFDGTYCGYVSFLFSLQGNRYGEINPLKAEQICKKVLNIEISSRHFPSGAKVRLGASGPYLARTFALGGSSITSAEFESLPWEPATFSGDPILFQEGNQHSLDAFHRRWQTFISDKHWIFYKPISVSHNLTCHNFILPRESASKDFYVRKSRIVLGRLYLEALFLRSAMSFIINNDLSSLPPDQRMIFAERLNECLLRLYGRKRPRSGMEADDYEEIRKTFVGLFDESRLQDLERSLRLLGARRNLRWLLASSDLFEDEAAKRIILNLEGEMTKKETHFHGPVGVAGDGTTASNFSVNQDNRKIVLGQDKEELMRELDQLKLSLASEIDRPESVEAIRNLNEASKAIEAEQEGQATSYLKSAGKWALDKAEKIGVSVAAAAIRHSLGI